MKNIVVTEAELTNLLMLLIDTVNDNRFLDLDKKYENTLDIKSLTYWENEIKKLSSPDCKILLPLALVTMIEKNDKINIGKVVSFIKFILTLSIRFINKISDLKSINNLVFLACDNIDTWLLRNLTLRPMPFLNPTNKDELDKWVRGNFITYSEANKNKEHVMVYKEMDELIDLVLDIKTKLQLGEPLNEYEFNTIVNILGDHMRILMEKARFHKGSIGICGYCNTIYYYTDENKTSNQFLALSPLETLCSECFIEFNKETHKFKDMYVKTFNKETNRELLRYLIFSTDY